MDPATIFAQWQSVLFALKNGDITKAQEYAEGLRMDIDSYSRQEGIGFSWETPVEPYPDPDSTNTQISAYSLSVREVRNICFSLEMHLDDSGQEETQEEIK